MLPVVENAGYGMAYGEIRKQSDAAKGERNIRSGKEWRLGGAAWQLWLPDLERTLSPETVCEAVARDGADCVRRKRQTIRQRN